MSESCALCPWTGNEVGRHLGKMHSDVPARTRALMVIQQRSEPAEDSDCILWTGATNAKGYGQIGWKDDSGKIRHTSPHRVVLGDPDGHALHTCDSPACVNPAHIVEGSNAENVRQRQERGRHHGSYVQFRPDEVLAVISMVEEQGLTHREVAEKMECSLNTIWRILSGRTWSTVTGRSPA